jgi:hypothetical protein
MGGSSDEEEVSEYTGISSAWCMEEGELKEGKF